MKENTLRPMSFLASSFWFGIISAFIAIGLHIVAPLIKKSGFIVFPVYYGTLFIASLSGIILSIYFYNRDKKRKLVNDQAFSARFWFKKLELQDLVWAFALLVFWVASLMLIKGLYSQVVTPPAYLTNIDGTLYGVPIKNSYWLIPVLSIFLIVNILGEELFWRGYMLPRQELRYGKRAWLVNGLLWSAFHAPLYWIAPALMPGCIALAFVTQKRKSIWPAIIAHLLLNGMDMAMSIFAFI